jgi:hypothetical protein
MDNDPSHNEYNSEELLTRLNHVSTSQLNSQRLLLLTILTVLAHVEKVPFAFSIAFLGPFSLLVRISCGVIVYGVVLGLVGVWVLVSGVRWRWEGEEWEGSTAALSSWGACFFFFGIGGE